MMCTHTYTQYITYVAPDPRIAFTIVLAPIHYIRVCVCSVWDVCCLIVGQLSHSTAIYKCIKYIRFIRAAVWNVTGCPVVAEV